MGCPVNYRELEALKTVALSADVIDGGERIVYARVSGDQVAALLCNSPVEVQEMISSNYRDADALVVDRYYYEQLERGYDVMRNALIDILNAQWKRPAEVDAADDLLSRLDSIEL